MTMGASFCPNCGVSVQPGGHFCASCGQPLATTPAATHPISESAPPSPPPNQWATAKVGAVGSQSLMPDWRGDLRTFPHELRTNRWWWISALLLLSAPVAYALALNTSEDAAGPFSLYVRLMVSPPAIPVLVAGFMSRRAPYLIGLVLGILDGILIAAFQVASLEPGAPVAQDAFLVGSVSVLSAAVLGAGFAWLAFIYKGWLQNSSRRRIEQREKQAQEQKRKARDEARQGRSKG
jgi:hypothetical protein